MGGRRGHGLRRLERLLEVRPRPVRAERAQPQARHQPLAALQSGERADDGDERVGAGVERVVVLEGAQRQELRAVHAQPPRPGALARLQPQGVLLLCEFGDTGLRVVRLELLARQRALAAAGQHRDAVSVAGDFEREGLRDGNSQPSWLV